MVYHVGTPEESLEKKSSPPPPKNLTHDFWAHEFDSYASLPPLPTLTL